MRRATVWLGSGLLALLAAALPLGALLKQRPDFYDRAAVPPGDDRRAQSGEFVTRYDRLKAGAATPAAEWQEIFTTDQINSFLQEDYRKLPAGFSDLRVRVEEGKLLIGCRHGRGLRSTVLSFEAKVWLVEDDVNVVAVEFLDMRAGVLPVPREMILDRISEEAARSGVAVGWRFHDDNPVAYLRFQPDKPRPTVLIRRLDLLPGRLIVAGSTP